MDSNQLHYSTSINNKTWHRYKRLCFMNIHYTLSNLPIKYTQSMTLTSIVHCTPFLAILQLWQSRRVRLNSGNPIFLFRFLEKSRSCLSNKNSIAIPSFIRTWNGIPIAFFSVSLINYGWYTYRKFAIMT